MDGAKMRLFMLLVMLQVYDSFGGIPLEREKRFIDFGSGWKKLFEEFPPTIRDVQRNAELRTAVDENSIKTVKHGTPDPYQTNFGGTGGEVVYMSMSTVPKEHKPKTSHYKSKPSHYEPQTSHHKPQHHGTTGPYTPLGSLASVESPLLKISPGHGSVKSEVLTHKIEAEPAPPAAYSVEPSSYTSVESMPAGFKQDEYTEGPRLRREVTEYDPAKRSSILGRGSVAQLTHYARVDKQAPKPRSEESSLQISKPKYRKRSVQTSEPKLEDDMDLELAAKIMANSKSPADALIKMLDAERRVDAFLHKMMGDVNQSSKEDAAELETLLKDSGVPDEMIKRSLHDNIEAMVKKSTESMAAINKMMETSDQDVGGDAVLMEIIQADREMTALLEKIMPAEHLDKAVKMRAKRDHGSAGYYDPELVWLVNNLDLSAEEAEEARRILYDASSVDSDHQFANTYTNLDHYSPSQPGHGYSFQPVEQPSSHSSHQQTGQYSNERENKMEKSAWHTFLDTLQPLASVVPPEVDAAYRGALGVGKHVTQRVRPYVHHTYNKFAREYLPQASATVSSAVGDDIKDFARQGRRIVETRARYAAQAADPHLQNLRNDLWLLQAQLRQVAAETSEYTRTEIVPSVGPALRGLLFDVQETLELANQMIEADVKPLVEKVSESVIKPAYATVTSQVVSPAASKVREYVAPVAEKVAKTASPLVEDYARPVVEYARPVVDYAGPIYYSAHNLAASGIDTARVTYQSVKPKIEELTVSTQKVLEEDVAPKVKVVASQVADGASRVGKVLQSDVVPHVKQGLSSTLHGLFTGLPGLVRQVSKEANGAAKVFTSQYTEALQELKAKAEMQRKEQEAKLNLVHKVLEDQKLAQANQLDSDTRQFDAILDTVVQHKSLKEAETKKTASQTESPEIVQSTTPKEL